MGIAKLIHEISDDFDLFGIIGNNVSRFKTNLNYDGFLIRKK